VVPPEEAQRAREALERAGRLRRDLKIRRGPRDVWIPVTEAAGDPLGGGRWDEGDFEPTRQVRSYKDIVEVPADLREELPTSFDVIGDVAVVKIPDALAPHAEAIGQAMLAAHANLRAVFHDKGVTGAWRVRDVVRIAGQGSTRTVHTEFGMRFEVDVAEAYFSPRLAGEHDRVARQVTPGEHVLDATAGVGPYAVAIAKRATGVRVVAVDANPKAVLLLRANVERNRVARSVTPLEADGFQVAVAGAPWSRIVVNLPHGDARPLGMAAQALVEGGTLHATRVLDDEEAAGWVAAFAQTADCHVVYVGRVHAYSPTSSLWAFDLVRAR
jgi:tRNA (guanine37-N1)-methyltransferase